MNVLCKKTCKIFDLIFENLSYYKIDMKNNTYTKTGIVNSYFIRTSKNYGQRFILNNFFEDFFPRYPKFSEHFYTEKELRKLKIEKIDIKNKQI